MAFLQQCKTRCAISMLIGFLAGLHGMAVADPVASKTLATDAVASSALKTEAASPAWQACPALPPHEDPTQYGYTAASAVDVVGNTLAKYPNILAAMQACNGDRNCKSFNSNGETKSSDSQSADGTTACLYTKLSSPPPHCEPETALPGYRVVFNAIAQKGGEIRAIVLDNNNPSAATKLQQFMWYSCTTNLDCSSIVSYPVSNETARVFTTVISSSNETMYMHYSCLYIKLKTYPAINLARTSGVSSVMASSEFRNATYNASAEKAIDGIASNDNWFSTNATDTEKWWEVNINRNAIVTYAELHNRKDCCGEQLDWPELWAYSPANNPNAPTQVWNMMGASTTGAVHLIRLNGALWPYKLSLENFNVASGIQSALTFTEMKLFGYYYGSSSSPAPMATVVANYSSPNTSHFPPMLSLQLSQLAAIYRIVITLKSPLSGVELRVGQNFAKRNSELRSNPLMRTLNITRGDFTVTPEDYMVGSVITLSMNSRPGSADVLRTAKVQVFGFAVEEPGVFKISDNLYNPA